MMPMPVLETLKLKVLGFTLRVYCHLLPGAPDRMRQAIDRAFSDPGLNTGGVAYLTSAVQR